MKGLCEKKFESMLVSGTFTMAVMYIMLLSDSIIAGYFIGETGVAAINAITPITAIITFFGDLLSTGVGIIFAREVGAMRKHRADEIYGQGLILSIGLGLITSIMLFALKDLYFDVSGITGDILGKALQYYRLVPVNAFLTVVIFYLEQMVFSDGDELVNNICYAFQIGGNIICSIVLARFMGMTGIILGSIIGNGLGILAAIGHFFRKENTLHFVWHLSFKDFLLTSRYSIVDSSVYICWGVMDYIMIGHVASHYGDVGLITLAVVINLIEFGVVMDGVGMAMQPLIGTYYGEGNHLLIKRVMKSAVKAAIAEGIVATLFIWAFTRQFCGLFGISDGPGLESSIVALRIVSLGFVFCSAMSLTTSYYMLIDRIGMATCISSLHNGLLYMALPLLGSALFGSNGMWAGFTVAPVIALVCAYGYVYLRFGREKFPFLLEENDTDLVVLDGSVSPETAASLSARVEEALLSHGYAKASAGRAALYIEEICLTILEKNRQAKKPILIELSLFFEPDSVLVIERDAGDLFDLTDPDMRIEGLSSFVLSALMLWQKDRAHLVTLGHNRNVIRFPKQA